MPNHNAEQLPPRIDTPHTLEGLERWIILASLLVCFGFLFFSLPVPGPDQSTTATFWSPLPHPIILLIYDFRIWTTGWYDRTTASEQIHGFVTPPERLVLRGFIPCLFGATLTIVTDDLATYGTNVTLHSRSSAVQCSAPTP